MSGPMSLNEVHALAALGYYLFPVKEGQKKPPLITRFYERATRNPAQLTAWFNQFPGCNWAISTDRFDQDGVTYGLLVVDVDVDVEAGKDGFQTVLQHELEGRAFPPTRTHSTPRGGRQYIYTVPEAVPQGAHTLGPNVDTRSFHGYIMAPGSRTEKGVYDVV